MLEVPQAVGDPAELLGDEVLGLAPGVGAPGREVAEDLGLPALFGPQTPRCRLPLRCLARPQLAFFHRCNDRMAIAVEFPGNHLECCPWPVFSPSFWPPKVRTPRCD